MTHIDRIGAYAAREAAVRAVRSGADECLVRLAYAPNHIDPIDIFYEMSGRGERQNPEFFSHPKMAARYPATTIGAAMAQGRHFVERNFGGMVASKIAGDAGKMLQVVRGRNGSSGPKARREWCVR
jgi:hypothetical protein